LVEANLLTRNEKITVGTTAVKIADRNLNRLLIYIKNTSSGGQTITVSFSETKPAVAEEGVVLAEGESITDSNGSGYECYKGAIWAISSAAGGQLSIYER